MSTVPQKRSTGRPKLPAFVFREPEAVPEIVWEPGWRGWVRGVTLTLARFVRRQSSWGISIFVHFLLALMMLITFIGRPDIGATVAIESALGRDQGDLAEFESLLISSSSAPAQSDAVMTNANSAEVVPSLMGEQVAVGDASLPETVQSMLGAGGIGQGVESKVGDGVGFFGASGQGNNFVFIVDMSGSMHEQNRFPRAVSELIRSIGKLKSHQKFYVFFFNHHSLPMFSPRPESNMIAATAANKLRVGRWIRSQRPFGRTNPDLSIEAALKLRPDAIFLLTDGVFEPYIAPMIRQLNTEKVVVHTIALQSPEGEPQLKEIAAQNGGTFRFVK